jgi:Rubisco LSMT substrate-binding
MQVYDSYGQKCNHRFLLNYGFAVENNIEPDGSCPNEVPLEIQLDTSDALIDLKAPLWQSDPAFESLDGSSSSNDVHDDAAYEEEYRSSSSSSANACRTQQGLIRIRVSAGDTDASRSLLSLLRLSCANSDEWTQFRSAREARFPLSLRCEAAALRKLADLVQVRTSKIKKFKVTLK